MQSTVNQRIKIIQETTGTQRNFAKKIGIKETTISSLFHVKATLPSFMVLEAILKAFPEISARWLMLGEGEMTEKYGYLELKPIDTEEDTRALSRRVEEIEKHLGLKKS